MENGGGGSIILIIQIHNQPFHYFEFVKPIEDIVKKNSASFETIHYKDLNSNYLEKARKIIVCGTSLKDNAFLEDINYFNWIKTCNMPILGICGGMHILGLIFDEPLMKCQEIGLNTINIKKEFFNKTGALEVYELHNFCIKSVLFEVIALSSSCPQIVKHKDKKFYGVLFHPEVRNKEIITSFINM